MLDPVAAALDKVNEKEIEDYQWVFYKPYGEIMDYLEHYDFSKDLAKLDPARR